jgi:AcrR family transcriptional regulator
MEQITPDLSGSTREERILDAACREFLRHGKGGARMQQIADDAGVNKALVYYYYRSKDQIFHAVIDRISKLLIAGVTDGIDFSMPFRTIVRKFIGNHLKTIALHGDVFQFFIGEIWTNSPDMLAAVSRNFKIQNTSVYTLFRERIERAVGGHEIRPVNPLHLMLNILGLDVFYFVAAPAFFAVTGMEPADRKKFGEQRADEIFEFVWESIRYRGTPETEPAEEAGI